jgi:VIT1/CCC1 family predicted Fe2+/Mn2+ transporter
MGSEDDIVRYRENQQDEVDSAALYRALSEIEPQSQLAKVYRKMAEAEENHIQFWSEKLQAAGGASEPGRPSWRTRVLISLARRFGPGFVLPTAMGRERGGGQSYGAQPETRGTAMPEAERSHERLLMAIAGNQRGGMEGGALAQLEGRHRASGGNALRAAVLGANDGLVSNLSLVMGVAGAALSGKSILITGLAGLLAGAGSMALGEWLSVQSSRELYQHQIKIEAEEIENAPEEETEELSLIYQAKGLKPEQADMLAGQIMADKSGSLDTLAREELGIDPRELGGSAWEAAGTSFLLFSIGAIIPVSPFFFTDGLHAVIFSLGLSAVGLFVIGAAITLLTGRPLVAAGLRQVLVGLAAAGLTFGVGKLIGVSIGG